MALQGNLRDFSATEILQLIGTQRKSGCLTLEWNTEHASIWVQDGRVVSTRQPGMAADDPLLAFLDAIHRLSSEQQRGLLTIHRESERDLEDLLLNGRYLDSTELAGLVERQILDDLMRIVRWDNGTYRFDPNRKWPGTPLVLLSMEGVLMEAARRMDEEKRFMTVFRDPHQLLGVRDLPDPDEPLSEEERELFGIIDGHHTVADVVAAAPLSEYEAYEALQRLLEANWLEFVGRRDPDPAAAAPAPAHPAARARPPWLREAAVTAALLAALAALRFGAARLPGIGPPPGADDVYAAAHVRDLRFALELYARENGRFPDRLDVLVDDRWIGREQLRMPGYDVLYRSVRGGSDYDLRLAAER